MVYLWQNTRKMAIKESSSDQNDTKYVLYPPLEIDLTGDSETVDGFWYAHQCSPMSFQAG
jgi:hypothetical protein